MNVSSKSQITALVVSFCRKHVNVHQALASQYYRQSILTKPDSTTHPTQDRFNIRSTNNVIGSGFTCKNLSQLQAFTSCTRFLGKPSSPLHQTGFASYHTLQSCSRHPITSSTSKESSYFLYNSHSVRHKSGKNRSEDNDESGSDTDDALDEDDFDAPTQFKVQTIHAPSLRIDAVLSNSIGLSRHRLEEIFFGHGFLLNGKKVLKKGGKVDEGDYVDAIMEKNDNQIKVKRVKLLKIGSEKTSTDKFILKVRIWKTPFLIDNPNQWKPNS